MELEQLFLTTPSLKQSRKFYEDTLNLKPKRIGDTSVSYDTGSVQLKIQEDFEPETYKEYNLTIPGNKRGAGAVYAVSVRNLDKHHRNAKNNIENGEILTQPEEVPWDGKMYLVESPEGYVFEVRERN